VWRERRSGERQAVGTAGVCGQGALSRSGSSIVGAMPLPPAFGLSPFTAQQAAVAGLSRSSLRRAVARGDARPVLHGVLVAREVPDTVATRAAAARLVLPRRSVVSHESAAALHGVDVLPPNTSLDSLPLHVVVARDEDVPHRCDVRARQALLPRGDVVVIEGVPTCSAVRTGLDLARDRSRVEAVVALDALLHAGACDIAELRRRVDGMVGWRGVRGARAALTLVEPLSESPMETRLRLCLEAAGLPRPVAQHVVCRSDGLFVARVDLAYPQCRLALEFDGAEAHGSTAAFRHDRERQNALLALGWTVLRFTAYDVVVAPARTAGIVRDALARLD
jgi:hypothetical protein